MLVVQSTAQGVVVSLFARAMPLCWFPCWLSAAASSWCLDQWQQRASGLLQLAGSGEAKKSDPETSQATKASQQALLEWKMENAKGLLQVFRLTGAFLRCMGNCSVSDHLFHPSCPSTSSILIFTVTHQLQNRNRGCSQVHVRCPGPQTETPAQGCCSRPGQPWHASPLF